ncbi:MAG: hypothetical protein AAGF71_07865 [Pseudomonadota bacterium]
MKNRDKTVMGVRALPAKPTFAGAFWMATMLAIPVAILGFLAETLVRMVW